MSIPPQGFRHAATLLLTNGIRGIRNDASPKSVAEALKRLADDLVALACDMRAAPEAKSWLIDEYGRTIDRLRQPFDAEAARDYAGRAIAGLGEEGRRIEQRDLFVIYVPEDRLPIAAPLAIALTKRRFSVAFSEFEVSTPEELVAAIADGLALHRAGIVLATASFDRAGLRAHLPADNRLRVLTADEALRIDELARSLRSLP